MYLSVAVQLQYVSVKEKSKLVFTSIVLLQMYSGDDL